MHYFAIRVSPPPSCAIREFPCSIYLFRSSTQSMIPPPSFVEGIIRTQNLRSILQTMNTTNTTNTMSKNTPTTTPTPVDPGFAQRINEALTTLAGRYADAGCPHVELNDDGATEVVALARAASADTDLTRPGVSRALQYVASAPAGTLLVGFQFHNRALVSWTQRSSDVLSVPYASAVPTQWKPAPRDTKLALGQLVKVNRPGTIYHTTTGRVQSRGPNSVDYWIDSDRVARWIYVSLHELLVEDATSAASAATSFLFGDRVKVTKETLNYYGDVGTIVPRPKHATSREACLYVRLDRHPGVPLPYLPGSLARIVDLPEASTAPLAALPDPAPAPTKDEVPEGYQTENPREAIPEPVIRDLMGAHPGLITGARVQIVGQHLHRNGMFATVRELYIPEGVERKHADIDDVRVRVRVRVGGKAYASAAYLPIALVPEEPNAESALEVFKAEVMEGAGVVRSLVLKMHNAAKAEAGASADFLKLAEARGAVLMALDELDACVDRH